MFWAVPTSNKKKFSYKWILPVGAFLAIAIVCVSIFLLGKNENKTVSVGENAAVPAVVVTTNGALNLNGKWTADLGTSTLLATVTDDGIEIQWATGDSSALYWKGTFPVPPKITDKFTVVSEGDLHAMDESMLGSHDLEKTFVYENGKINFSLTALGVTTKVHLAR